MRSHIDLVRLRFELEHLARSQPIYKVIKEVLTEKGYWRNKPRGNPKKGYQMRGTKKKVEIEVPKVQ